MGEVVAGLASSHAFTFMPIDDWDEFRERNRRMFQERYGFVPEVPDGVLAESMEENRKRFAAIQEALNAIRAKLASTLPDVLIVVGDDQDENFSTANIPQLAVYAGGDFTLANPLIRGSTEYTCHREFARDLLEQGVLEGFDLASVGRFEGDELRSHAHAQVLANIMPGAEIPVVLVFMNAIHHPSVEPWRCTQFGELLSRVTAKRPANERVAIYASGGWSHFTAGYPWLNYRGQAGHGDIDEDFDKHLVDTLTGGDTRQLSKLSGADLLEHGQVELRAWIALLAALGDEPHLDFLTYEPFYRGLMGMAVGSWTPRDS
ncbi:aromatic ring-opening dioxygenase LigB subunit [Nocardioides massiliensis]|uniref:Aromatic ring-opening dioxygenase LigB subunit n=2 Tax=Nocardioides massiliensis TaxID=1325935 RepID=A0ABT9NT93_9ACTN|nr:hypothetical protein [Nocardioides massiliensis]MDP9823632.1 aromatic ring-opening dioxygenase LigB subunit [Nocardioides massiliensis]